MTYKKLYEDALFKLEHNKITLGEFEEMIKPLEKEIEQEPNTWSLDDARENFMHDVYNTLDFLPTNNEANRIIDSFDRVTSGIRQEPILDKIKAEIEQRSYGVANDSVIQGKKSERAAILEILDKYKGESEET